MSTPTQLRVRTLLALHLVIPACAGVITLDWLALGGRLAAILPTHPDALIGFTLLFNLPHIIASEVILLDREYLRAHGRLALGVAVATALAAVAAPILFSSRVWFGLLLAVTLVHVVGQQVGIAGMLSGLHRTRGFRAWRWGSTAVALAVYAQWTPAVGVTSAERPFLRVAVWVTVIALTLVVFAMGRRVETRQGRAYLWATHSMVIAMAGFAEVGYPALALLVPRFVHDTTAFAFYMVHDVNRNRTRHKNVIYRLLSFTGLPVWILGPALAIAVAALIETWVPVVFIGVLVGTLSMVHYVLEAMTWRGNGLYRAHVPLLREGA